MAARQFSTAAGIRSRFEEAYEARIESLKKRPAAPREAEDKKTYG